ncbi:MAG: ABC transporter ATP-binding protein [SAR116 cluster bacterium]|jgi:subfamily B ATP-binding cassette protein MsbA|nr:MAG: ABC transporter ATP-binding protein [SAR116 cluster bacterium]|tara:strand:- start:428 stop:2191 length:1764 start_codon:yes stop_codon:yes gene_type:complete
MVMTNASKKTFEVIQEIWKGFAKPFTGLFAFAIFLMVIVAVSGAVYPAIIQQVFNHLAGEETIFQYNFLTLVPLSIICIALIKAVAMYLQIITVNRFAQSIATAMQTKMMSHLINADLGVITQHSSGVFISRIMNDVNLIKEAVVRLSNNLIRDSLTILVMIGMLFWFDFWLSVLVLAIYPIAFQPILRIGRKQRGHAKRLQITMEEMTSVISEIIGGSRMIKAFELEDTQKFRASQSFDKLKSAYLSLLSGRARIDPVLEVLGGIAIAGVVGVASWRVSNGEMLVGDVLGFITALLMLVQPVRALGTLNAVTQEGVSAANRALELLATEPDIQSDKNAIDLNAEKAEIEFSNVSFSYDTAPILQDITFTIKAGETVALVGESGAGKTTIMNLIPRFFDSDKGIISINKLNIKQISIHSLRAHIALISQDSILFDDTVMANIGFGKPDARETDIIEAARKAAADGFITALPQGYHTNVGPQGNLLSGGQRQRIAIARAILKDAPILLMDEATSALDAQSEQLVQDALEQSKQGRTSLIIAHRLATIKSADRIYVMASGKIIETGTHESLLEQKGAYAKMISLQQFSK